MMGVRRHGRGGFTFVELLVAMLLIAVLTPVAVSGLRMANRLTAQAVRRRLAQEVARRVLETAIADESWRNGDIAVDDDLDYPNLSWTVKAGDYWDDDKTMRVIEAKVYYVVQGRTLCETLTTLDQAEEEETDSDSSSTSDSEE